DVVVGQEALVLGGGGGARHREQPRQRRVQGAVQVQGAGRQGVRLGIDEVDHPGSHAVILHRSWGSVNREASGGWRTAVRSRHMEHAAFEFHIARQARDRYGFADRLFAVTGNVVVADLAASRELAHRMNTVREAAQQPDLAVNPGALNAMGLLDEVTHVVLQQYRLRRDPRAVLDALGWFEARLTRKVLDAT